MSAGNKVRWTISLPRRVAEWVDKECVRTGETRSGFIGKAIVEMLEAREMADVAPVSPEMMVNLLESALAQERAKLER